MPQKITGCNSVSTGHLPATMMVVCIHRVVVARVNMTHRNTLFFVICLCVPNWFSTIFMQFLCCIVSLLHILFRGLVVSNLQNFNQIQFSNWMTVSLNYYFSNILLEYILILWIFLKYVHGHSIHIVGFVSCQVLHEVYFKALWCRALRACICSSIVSMLKMSYHMVYDLLYRYSTKNKILCAADDTRWTIVT